MYETLIPSAIKLGVKSLREQLTAEHGLDPLEYKKDKTKFSGYVQESAMPAYMNPMADVDGFLNAFIKAKSKAKKNFQPTKFMYKYMEKQMFGNNVGFK